MSRNKTSIPALLALQPMMGKVTPEGTVLSAVPVGIPEVIDVVDIETAPGESTATITSRTTGASVSVGFTPAYGDGYDLVFGARTKPSAS